jgi:probable F420-dependent oxidoreductase
MRNGVVLFTSDRGITPGALARAAEDRGFDTIYVPEHTHIPVRRRAAHPGTGDETLPDDRYLRTLDPWVSLATAAALTSRIGLSTAVALPVESDPITLAKQIATLDHLSGGRVTIGAGFGWNTDELADHHVPAGKRRTVLKEYVEAMRALWTQEEASYDGEFVSFGPSWAYPKPAQAHIPLIIGAGGGPKTFRWIAENADGWMTTPTQQDIGANVEALKSAWADAGRPGAPDIRVLIAFRPDPADLAAWAERGVTELIWGVPDRSEDEVVASLDRMAARLGLGS